MQTFGDNKIFAFQFRYDPDKSRSDKKSKTAICHFVIDGKLIGREDEVCYLPTWFSSVTRIKEFVNDNQDTLFRSEFVGKTHREIFELIFKSNQLENDFDPRYTYLPQLDNRTWQTHYFSIDETTDPFLMSFYIQGGDMNFMIKGLLDKSQPEKDECFIYKNMRIDYFIDVLSQALDFLEQRFPYLSRYK